MPRGRKRKGRRGGAQSSSNLVHKDVSDSSFAAEISEGFRKSQNALTGNKPRGRKREVPDTCGQSFSTSLNADNVPENGLPTMTVDSNELVMPGQSKSHITDGQSSSKSLQKYDRPDDGLPEDILKVLETQGMDEKAILNMIAVSAQENICMSRLLHMISMESEYDRFISQLDVALVDFYFSAPIETTLIEEHIFMYHPSNELKSLYDAAFLSEDEFWFYFHIRRSTFKTIVKHAEDLIQSCGIDDFPNDLNVSLETTLLLACWYLRQDIQSPSKGSKFFNFPSEEMFSAIFKRGLAILCSLKDQSGMEWPQNGALAYSCDYFYLRFKLKNVIGVLHHEVFTTIDKKRMLLQVLCNEQNVIVDVAVTYDTRPKIGLRSAIKFYEKLLAISEDMYVVGDAAYGEITNPLRSKPLLLTPLEYGLNQSSELTRVVTVFNRSLDEAVGVARKILNAVKLRFPGINKLNDTDINALTAACVLHNFTVREHPPLDLPEFK